MAMTTLNNTRPLASASEIAEHYGRTNKSGGNYQIKCPVHTPHEGQGPNLSLKDTPGGGLLVHCHSRGCSFNDILAAFRRDGLKVSREWTYPTGKVVRRTDGPDLRKGRTFKDTDSQTIKGVPLLIRRDGLDFLIVITEGESDADAVLSADLESKAAACFPGGAGNAGSADYSAVKGRNVAIWADNDAKGAAAQIEAAKAATEARAASVKLVPMVGQAGDGQGAADCPPAGIEVFLGALLDFNATPDKEDALPARRDWEWRNLADAADIPAAIHLVNGLLINGNITLWYAPAKTGKSRLLMGLLAAMSPDGPQFCGMDLAPTPTLLFTEEPPTAIGDRVRDLRIPREANHYYNSAAALAMRAEDFAEDVYAAYHNNGGAFGLVAIDTLSAFVNCGDWNDYAAVGAAMSPLRQLARSLPNVAILLLHHQNKAGEGEWNGALGSTALIGSADQLVRMAKAKNGQHTIIVGGRNKPDPFPFDEPITIAISETGVQFVGTAADAAQDILADYLTSEPTTIKDLREAMGEDAPTDDVLRPVLKAWVAEGKVVQVTESKGNKGATYRRP